MVPNKGSVRHELNMNNQGPESGVLNGSGTSHSGQGVNTNPATFSFIQAHGSGREALVLTVSRAVSSVEICAWAQP